MCEINGDMTVRPAVISFVDNLYTPSWEWIMKYDESSGDMIIKKVGVGNITTMGIPGSGSGALTLASETAISARDFVIYANNSAGELDTGRPLFLTKFATGYTGLNTANPETAVDVNGNLRVERRLYFGAYTANVWYFEASAGDLSLYYLDNAKQPQLAMSWQSP
jgi:hypothetical protein